MRWRDARRSTNVTNRGGMGGMGGKAIGGGAGLIIAIIAMVLGVNPGDIMPTGAEPTAEQGPVSAQDSALQVFTEHILGDTEDTWNAIFASMGKQYEEPRLNIFNGYVQSACGLANEAMGPFYCTADREVYIDLSFYEDLRTKFGADGDLAQAYVIAHEVGHHVQNLLGVSDEVGRARQGATAETANKLSVRMELQADCFAGLWAYSADKQRNLLDAGDIGEALTAAAAIGDDRLQQEAQGRVVPESFTHGTSAQRQTWFNRGYQAGDIKQCDTFSERVL